MEGDRKNVRFSTENWSYSSETVRDTAKVTIITNRNWYIGFQTTWKSSTLDDQGHPWKSVLQQEL